MRRLATGLVAALLCTTLALPAVAPAAELTLGPQHRFSSGSFDFFDGGSGVAYNPQANQYLVVWLARDESTDEAEVFGRLADGAGGPVGAEFRISQMGPDGDTSFSAREPDVVYNAQANEYLVVWTGDDDTAPLVDGEVEVFGQRLTAAGAATGNDDFRISAMGPDGSTSFSAREPDVVYNAQANEYLVAWWGSDNTPPLVSGESEIFGQRLTAAGAETGSDDFRISAMGPDGNTSFDALLPVVAHNAQANEYLVTWQGDDNTAPLVDDEFEIFGQRLTAAGAETGSDDFRISAMGPDGSDEFPAFDPAVAYNAQANEFLVTWEGGPIVNTGSFFLEEFEIHGQRLTAAGAETGSDDFRISSMGPDGDGEFQAINAALAYNSQANEYLVTWEGDDNTAPLVEGEREVFGQRLTAAGAETGSDDLRISSMGPNGNFDFDAHRPAVAYNTLAKEYLVAWDGNENGDDVFAAFARSVAPDADGDGFSDSTDACVDESDLAAPRNPRTGCLADTDGDGFSDPSDACVNESDLAAPRNPRTGCPADPVVNPVPPPDTDGDGFPDSTDACVNQSDLAAPRNPRTGCPADPVVNPPPDPDIPLAARPVDRSIDVRVKSPRLASDSVRGRNIRLDIGGKKGLPAISHFVLQYRRTGRGTTKAYTTLSPRLAKSTTRVQFKKGKIGETYLFRIVAIGTGGKRSAFHSSRTAFPYDDRGKGRRYSRGWRRVKNGRAWLGGYSQTSRRGATLTFSTRGGGRVYLVARTGPNGGRAVFGRGTKQQVVSFRTRKRRNRRVVAILNRTDKRIYRFKLRVLSGTVTIDGLGVRRR